MGQYTACFSPSLLDIESKWGVDGFTDLHVVTHEICNRQERKLCQKFRADSLRLLQQNPFWQVPCRNIPGPKNIQTRSEEKGMKNVALGKREVSSSLGLYVEQKNPGYMKSHRVLLLTQCSNSWLMASPVHGNTTEKLVNYLLCVLPPQISALMRHPAKSSVCLPKRCASIFTRVLMKGACEGNEGSSMYNYVPFLLWQLPSARQQESVTYNSNRDFDCFLLFALYVKNPVETSSVKDDRCQALIQKYTHVVFKNAWVKRYKSYWVCHATLSIWHQACLKNSCENSKYIPKSVVKFILN